MLPRPPSSTLFPYTTLFRSFVVVTDPQKKQRIGEWYRDSWDQYVAAGRLEYPETDPRHAQLPRVVSRDRKSTRLNSSHVRISYAVFCLKKKKKRGASDKADD